jgi:hypothetical protein
MQELIQKLTEKAGISPEQAEKVLEAVKDFVKEKFPMMAGAVDNLLGSDAPAASGAQTEPGTDFLDSAKDKLSGMFGG